MRKAYCFFILFFSVQVLAQGEANIWYFGQNAGLDFNSGAPLPLYDGQLNTNEGCATINNASGQLLFYTDGITVWNKNHSVMPNGSGLLGHPSSTQSAIAVPFPNDSNKYYLFTITEKGFSDGFCYSVVDMTLNGGLGDITSIKNVQIKTPVCEKLTAVKNANNNGYWVLVHGFGDDSFYAYSITSAGINLTPIISHTGIVVDNSKSSNAIGYLKFSPSGSKIIACHTYLNIAELFDFNKTTGEVSNPRTISTKLVLYGAEFSPSENLAYITSDYSSTNNLKPKVYQYNLNASNIQASEVLLYTSNNIAVTYAGSALQMGPDGKIYCAGLGNSLHRVNNPDVLGIGCNFTVNAVNLGPGTHFSKLGLPQFIQSVFESSINNDNVCQGQTSFFSLTNTTNVLNVTWDFGDSSPIQTGLTTNHVFTNSGNFTVTASITTNAGVTVKTKQITIFPTPFIANIIPDKSLCQTSASYDLSQHDATLLGSQPTSVYGVKYFNSLVDASSNVNPLPLSYTLNYGLNTIFVRVYNLTNPNCFVTSSFNILLYKQPIANPPTDYVICENAPYNNSEVFDLATKNNEILNGQSTNDYTVTYHASLSDATNDVASLPLNYTNTQANETIYARVENNANPTCFATTAVSLKVYAKPLISTISNVNLCDDSNNDGKESYDLAQKDTEILNGQLVSTFGVSYFASQSDALTNTNPITIIQATLNVKAVYTRIFNKQLPNCFEIGSFSVTLFKQAVANKPTDYIVCESTPYNGIELFDLTTKNVEVLGNQLADDFSITYHKTLQEANAKTNALSLQYTNSLSQETIYVRIENKSNANCFSITNFDIKVIQSPAITTVADYKQCDDISNDGIASFDLKTKKQEILNGQSNATFEVSYHYTQNEATLATNPITTAINNTSQNQVVYYRIFVKTNPSCFVVGSFKLVVNTLPSYNVIPNQMVCDDDTNDGKNIFNLYALNGIVLGSQNPNNFDVSYYTTDTDAQANTNRLPQYFQNNTNPQTIYVRIENKDNISCYQIGSFILTVSKQPIANPIQDKIQCANGKTSTFVLNDQELSLLGNQSANDFNITYHTSFVDAQNGTNKLQTNYISLSEQQTIVVRIENKINPNCYALTDFEIITRQNPVLNMNGIYSICEGSTVTVTAPNGYDSYLWSNGDSTTQTTIASEGSYSLTVTKTYPDITCDQTVNFEVFKSNIATIQNIEIKDWTDNQNSISVIVSGHGDYEYSIDGINYQDSNSFENLSSGEYTITVRDKKGCGSVSEQAYVLSYPKFFTPNSDGFHDSWKINFSHNEPNLSVHIFNRFGKLLKTIASNSQGWDGNYLGNPLPADDYWFVVKRENGKEYKGHFALKR